MRTRFIPTALLAFCIAIVGSPSASAAPDPDVMTGVAAHAQLLDEAVEKNTKEPAPITGEAHVKQDGAIESALGLSVKLVEKEPASVRSRAEVASDVTPSSSVKAVNRADGLQLVSLIEDKQQADPTFQFPGKHLDVIHGGYVLVRPGFGEAPEYIIDPAWAVDKNGTNIKTEYRVEGDRLTQVVSREGQNFPIVADPYIRDVHAWGMKIGQEMVFTKAETSRVAAGGGFCAALAGRFGWPGWVISAGCAGAGAIAAHALGTDRCLALRAVGSPYAPNVIFPLVTRC